MQESLEEHFERVTLNTSVPKCVYKQLLTQATSSKRNQKASPLLALPAELRNRIYEEVLVKVPWRDIDEKTRALRYKDFKKATSLVKVCRQVKFETSELATDSRVMSFADSHHFRRCVAHWTPLQREIVRRLLMRCHLAMQIAPESPTTEHYTCTFDRTWPAFEIIPELPGLKMTALEFTVDVSGCSMGYNGLERDIRAVTKRIATLAKSLGDGVDITRTFVVNKED